MGDPFGVFSLRRYPFHGFAPVAALGPPLRGYCLFLFEKAFSGFFQFDRQGRRPYQKNGGHGPPYLKSTTITTGLVPILWYTSKHFRVFGGGAGNPASLWDGLLGAPICDALFGQGKPCPYRGLSGSTAFFLALPGQSPARRPALPIMEAGSR